MKFVFLDSFLVFTLRSSLSGPITLTFCLWTTLLTLIFLLTSHQKKGNQKQPSMELVAVCQLEQVYGTVYVYR